MAGNHPKKSTERKDSTLKQQQQRKNSASGKKESNNSNNTTTTNNNGKTLLNNQKAQAAGAAILSAVTSPQAASLIQPQQQSIGANGFNRGEIVEFLNMRFSDALTAYHDTNLDPSMRPEKYESISKAPTTAWGKNSNGVPSAWGQQSKERDAGIMANGIDFLTELNKK